MPREGRVEDYRAVEAAIDRGHEISGMLVLLVVRPQAERAAPRGIPARREIDDEVQPALEMQLGMHRVIEMHIELAAPAVQVPAAAVKARIGEQAVHAGQVGE